MTESGYMDPSAFPRQPPPGNQRVAEYIEEASAASRRVMQAWQPQRFAYGSDPSHKLDVFASPAQERLRPALLFFHGGAWTTGYLWWSSFMAPGVHKAGGVLVTPTYRLGPDNRFPTQLKDVAAAIAWVWKNGEAFGIDRTQLMVGGHSAGGHLAALAALHPQALPAAGVPASVIKACFPVSASFNLHYPDAPPGSGEERVYKNLLAGPEDDHAASPINYLSASAPPFHIVVGQRDFDRIKRTSRDMSQSMASRRLPVQLEEWSDCDHFDTHLALTDPLHHWFATLRDAFSATTMEKATC